jgi:hypothetical protein
MADRDGIRAARGARASTRGVVFVHSCPRALAAHVEWVLADVLGAPVDLTWIAQPVDPGTVRTEVSWTGTTGTAARIVSALRGWGRVRFEVTEEPTATTEGERYSVTPSLGVFRALVGVHGDLQVTEERLRGALARAGSGPELAHEIGELLGTAWDAELEAFRYAGDGAPVRWLRQGVS